MSPAVDGRWAAEWVAQWCGLSVQEVFGAHTEEMGSPGDFYMEGARTFYTDAGLRKLAVGLQLRGFPGAGEAVRRKLEPAAVTRFWWQDFSLEEAA